MIEYLNGSQMMSSYESSRRTLHVLSRNGSGFLRKRAKLTKAGDAVAESAASWF